MLTSVKGRKRCWCRGSFSKLADHDDKNLYRLKHCYPKLVSESNIQATYHSPVWEAGSKHTLTRPSVFSQRHMNQTSKPTHGTEYSTGEVNYTSTEVGIGQQQVWPDRGLLWFKFSLVAEDVSLSRHFSPPLFWVCLGEGCWTDELFQGDSFEHFQSLYRWIYCTKGGWWTSDGLELYILETLMIKSETYNYVRIARISSYVWFDTWGVNSKKSWHSLKRLCQPFTVDHLRISPNTAQ